MMGILAGAGNDWPPRQSRTGMAGWALRDEDGDENGGEYVYT